MAENLSDVRDRIKSVKNTQQITKAMKMVSAAKLRRAQQAIVEIRPYANRLDKMMKNILSNLEGDVNTKFGIAREVKKPLVVVVTSNRGLCGAFNANVVKEAVKVIDEKYAAFRSSGDLSIMFIGKKGYDSMRKKYANCNLITDHVEVINGMTFDKVAEISDDIMNKFNLEEIDAVNVCFGRFKNAGTQYPECVDYLPVPKVVGEKNESKIKADYLFEPDKESLIEELIPSILRVQFNKYLLDTHASEHGARMTAMDKATENAEDLMGELKLNYNKARQAAITNELSEIVSGAMALGG
jgi:F-type H+-transporting ATPase subunit gamma